MEPMDIYGYLRAHAGELGERILTMYPPLQRITDDIPGELSTLLRSALPAQAIAIGGLAKHLRSARSARIVAECGAGKTFMALGVAHVLKARTILVMCPSHIAKKWAREAIKTIPYARTFLVEDMRNGGDPKRTASARFACARVGSFTKECNCLLPSCGSWDGTVGDNATRSVRCSSFRRTRASCPTFGGMPF